MTDAATQTSVKLKSTVPGGIARELKFVLYVGGLYASFMYWGVLQETLTSVEYENGKRWDFPLTLNCCMAFSGYIASVIFEMFLNESKSNNHSIFVYWKAALTSAIASPLAYASLKYISYPLMALTKSSKPVPVMAVGIIFYRRTYPWYKYVATVLICAGISLFSSGKASKGSSEVASIHSLTFGLPFGQSVIISEDSVQFISLESLKLAIGVIFVLTNLALDGYTNNEQDEIYKAHSATSMQMMKYTNIWQAMYLLGYLCIAYTIQNSESELYKSIDILTTCPRVQMDVLQFCICASVGQVLLFGLMREFGSLTWVTVSVTRKLFTVLLSVIMFKHAVKPSQWLGIVAVAVGLLLELSMQYVKQGTESKEKAE